MARFRFRLEPLLKLRELREEQRKRKLAEVVKELSQYREQEEKILSQISECYDLVRSKCMKGPVEISSIIADRRYLNQLHAAKKLNDEAIEKTEYKLEYVRRELMEAKKQKDIIKKVKEKLKARFMEEERKKEDKELDDLTSSRMAWFRSRGVGYEDAL